MPGAPPGFHYFALEAGAADESAGAAEEAPAALLSGDFGRLRVAAASSEGPNRRHGREKRDDCDVLHVRFLLRASPERGRGRGLLCLR